ncbi:MAG: hypothetical protein IKQ35_04440 [Bacilli bacterium]|nr:hypothetical protein [Bacilli bacterium]
MDLELIKKLDELIVLFDQNSNLKRIEELKEEIYKDKELSKKIETLKNTDQYSSNYLNLKKDLMSDSRIKEFKRLESDIILLTLSINKKLNTLVRKKGCFHENN